MSIHRAPGSAAGRAECAEPHRPELARSARPADAAERAVELVRAQAPLRRALAAIAGRLVARRAWERLGFARLADYARERSGLSARQIQELAHVDGAFARLPELERAFLAGELCWTRARLVARVATPADVVSWLEIARRLTVRELSRQVRAVDRRARDGCGRGGLSPPGLADEPEPRENVILAIAPAVRARWYHARQLAQRVAGERLAAWQCAEAVAAEVLSAGVAPVELGPDPGPRPGRGERAAPPRRDPTASRRLHLVREPSRVPRSLTEGLAAADAFELDARLGRAARLERSFSSRLGPLLLVVAEERLHRGLGCASLDAFAEEWLGCSPRSVHALLRIERACLRWASLRTTWREARLSPEQALALAALTGMDAARAFAADWIEHAGRVTVRRLADDVDRAISAHLPDPALLATRASWELPQPAPAQGLPRGLQTRAQARALGRTARLHFNAPRDVARLFRATLASVQRAIERREGRASDESEAFAAMLDHALGSWSALRAGNARTHRVLERDGWRCTVPGCTSYRELHDHHVRFRAAGGSDEPWNRTTLCAWHHLRGVHAGRVRCQGRAPAGLVFELGLRDGQAPLLRIRSDGERVTRS